MNAGCERHYQYGFRMFVAIARLELKTSGALFPRKFPEGEVAPAGVFYCVFHGDRPQ
jgi:hypothetical protein